MTYRLFDFECQQCGITQERLAWVDIASPKAVSVTKYIRADCVKCGEETKHTRVISLPAPYYGERDYAPSVTGGRFDTNGYERVERPKEHDLRDCYDLTNPEKRDKAQEIVTSKSYREFKRERIQLAKRNKAKRDRARAIERGERINLRSKSNQLPGDPVKALKSGAT